MLLILICVTYILTISIFTIYGLLLFYISKLYCTVFFYSCITSVIFVMSFMLVWYLILTLFIFNCQLTDVGFVKYVCVCVCNYVCMYVCTYVCMYVCMHVCMYVCMYVCRYVCCFSHPQKWQLLGAKYGMNTGYAMHFHSMWRNPNFFSTGIQKFISRTTFSVTVTVM